MSVNYCHCGHAMEYQGGLKMRFDPPQCPCCGCYEGSIRMCDSRCECRSDFRSVERRALAKLKRSKRALKP